MSRLVTVDHLAQGIGSVLVYTGMDEQNRIVTFGVDHRVAMGLDEAVEERGEVVCAVEEWQILSLV